MMQSIGVSAIYNQIFSSTIVAIGITDLEGKYIMVNPAWRNYLGYSEEEAHGLCVSDVTPVEDRPDSELNFSRLVTLKTPSIRTKRRYLCKDGSTLWADLHVTALFNDNHEICCVMGLFVNIDPQKKAEDNLERLNSQLSYTNSELQAAMKGLRKLARRDPLTKLYNRRVLEEAIRHEILRSSRSKRGLGVAIGDIDDFKHINDTYGHDCGDLVLIELAKVLRNEIRAADIVGRWGGEEFLFVFPETSCNGAMIVIERIRKAVAAILVNCSGEAISITMSLGLSYQNEDPKRDSIITEADKALYQAKKDGKNKSYCFQKLKGLT